MPDDVVGAKMVVIDDFDEADGGDEAGLADAATRAGLLFARWSGAGGGRVRRWRTRNGRWW
jgi:hypothetical protein